jgi:hypothetical protein
MCLVLIVGYVLGNALRCCVEPVQQKFNQRGKKKDYMERRVEKQVKRKRNEERGESKNKNGLV